MEDRTQRLAPFGNHAGCRTAQNGKLEDRASGPSVPERTFQLSGFDHTTKQAIGRALEHDAPEPIQCAAVWVLVLHRFGFRVFGPPSPPNCLYFFRRVPCCLGPKQGGPSLTLSTISRTSHFKPRALVFRSNIEQQSADLMEPYHPRPSNLTIPNSRQADRSRNRTVLEGSLGSPHSDL